MTTKEKPIHTVKLGLIEAAIWQNTSGERVRYNVTLKRIYRTEENGETKWRSTASFGHRDLLLAAKVLDEAHSWILREKLTGLESKTEFEAPSPE